MGKGLEQEVAEQLSRLDDARQRQVLEFARSLAETALRGTPGSDLTRFSGAISRDDLDRITIEIQRGCEQVDTHGW